MEREGTAGDCQAVPLRSPAAAARQRERGPSVSERRAAEEAAAAGAEEDRAAARAAARVNATAVVNTSGESKVNGACQLGRGRAARNAPLTLGGSAPAMEDRKQTLLAKAESRRLSLVVGLAPAGAGKLNEMPERDTYAAGSAGNDAWEAEFFDFVNKNFSGTGGQLRAADQHELRAGHIHSISAWYMEMHE